MAMDLVGEENWQARCSKKAVVCPFRSTSNACDQSLARKGERFSRTSYKHGVVFGADSPTPLSTGLSRKEEGLAFGVWRREGPRRCRCKFKVGNFGNLGPGNPLKMVDFQRKIARKSAKRAKFFAPAAG